MYCRKAVVLTERALFRLYWRKQNQSRKDILVLWSELIRIPTGVVAIARYVRILAFQTLQFRLPVLQILAKFTNSFLNSRSRLNNAG